MKLERMYRPVTRWADFRRRQLAALEESNRIAARVRDDDETAEDETGIDEPADLEPPVVDASVDGTAPRVGAGAVPSPAAASGGSGRSTAFGVVGRPLNRHSPFYLGFLGATGALLAIGLWHLVGKLTTTLTLLVVSMFLACTMGLSAHAALMGTERFDSAVDAFARLIEGTLLRAPQKRKPAAKKRHSPAKKRAVSDR